LCASSPGDAPRQTIPQISRLPFTSMDRGTLRKDASPARPDGVAAIEGDVNAAAEQSWAQPQPAAHAVLRDLSEAPILDKTVPLSDQDGFFNSAEILERFHEDGYVVVTDVFDKELVDRSILELWTSDQLLGRGAADGRVVKRDDPRTWTKETWPQADGGHNFLEPLDPYLVQSTWELLQHQPVSDVFQLVWQECQGDGKKGERLFVTDKPRWGIMRPTKNNPEWKTQSKWLHWDQNPWTCPGFSGVQGFAQLSAGTGESGGLLLVPGAHTAFTTWGEAHPKGTVFHNGVEMTDHGRERPFMVPEDDPLQRRVRRVVAPAGSLVLWDSRIPHQNYPNTSADQFRHVVYLCFKGKSEIPQEEFDELLERQYKRAQVHRAMGWDDVFWPSRLTELGAELTGAPTREESEQGRLELEANEGLVQAIRIAHAAGVLEVNGQINAAMLQMKRANDAFKRVGDTIDSWSGALWG